MSVITRLFLYPPMAFARLGGSDVPCDAFHWGPNDKRPRGTGKTTIKPTESLDVGSDGRVTARIPKTILFKDQQGFRPICPFFVLHGEWTERGRTMSGAITEQTLKAAGFSRSDLIWTVRVGNLKPYHRTLEDGDRIEATVEITGDRTDRRILRGGSPRVSEPLVPADRPVPLGSIQLTKPSRSFPELRLRFTPAKGLVYGPTDLRRRLAAAHRRYSERSWPWVDLDVPQRRLILNPKASWCRFIPPRADPRTVPGGLVATENGDGTDASLGLVDDVCDGFVQCVLPGLPPASARIVVAPPDYAPDRRPFTSIADGLKDRVDRYDVLDPAYVADVDSTTREIRDFMERVLETMDLINVDFQNERAGQTNPGSPASRQRPFQEREIFGQTDLPLTEKGRQRHKRFVSSVIFEDILREQPDLIERMVRSSDWRSGARFDEQMPAVMRGADSGPMYITRRQYELLRAWAARLRRDTEAKT